MGQQQAWAAWIRRASRCDSLSQATSTGRHEADLGWQPSQRCARCQRQGTECEASSLVRRSFFVHSCSGSFVPKVFTWGHNDKAQLGLGKGAGTIEPYPKVVTGLESVRIINVSCGPENGVAVTGMTCATLARLPICETYSHWGSIVLRCSCRRRRGVPLGPAQ